MVKAVLVAGANSGCGKTTVTLGLMAAFVRMGLTVQGFKVGPDYIDPSLHSVVTGRPSVNLDSWMMSDRFLRLSFATRATAADISVVEGVMGLHDGKSAISNEGSTAELAEQLKLPVILVVNASAMARTAAAVVKGLAEFNPALNIIGVVFNKVGSDRHLQMLAEAVEYYCALPVLGGLQKDAGFQIPSRHLGLFMGDEDVLPPETVSRLAEVVGGAVDLSRILSTARVDVERTPLPAAGLRTTRGKIAVAMDAAFCFYYEDNLEILQRLGFVPVAFSPLTDRKLPDGIDGVYFGGGYPELYALALAENESMRDSVRRAGRSGMMIYAECGGLMYLGQSIKTMDGRVLPMAGCMNYHTKMMKTLRTLGYVEVTLEEDFFLFRRASTMRGHVFHYSEIVFDQSPPKNIYTGTPSEIAVGYRKDNILASYVHLHFGSGAGLCPR